MQFDAMGLGNFLLHQVDQATDVVSLCVTGVHDEVGMHFRHLGATDAASFQSKPFDPVGCFSGSGVANTLAQLGCL